MKRCVSFLPAFALLSLLGSCYRDRGNYDYRDINEPEVTIAEVEAAADATLVYDRLATATLTPTVKINGAVANPDDFEYEWRMLPRNPVYYEGTGWEQTKTIGDGKSLSYLLDDYPRIYTVSLSVRNRATGAESIYKFSLDISTWRGWVVVDRDASGAGDMSIIRDGQLSPGLSADRLGVARDIYSQSNDGAALMDVRFANYRNMGGGQYNHIYVYSDDGVYKIDPKGLNLVTDDYTAMFSIAPETFEPMADYYQSPEYGMVQTFIANGNAYVISWNTMMQKDVYGTPLGVFGVPSMFAPFIAGIPAATGRSNSAVLFYDKSDNPQGAFATVTSYGSLGMPGTQDTEIFNPLMIGAGMDLVYLGTGRDGVTCAIFRDNSDNGAPYLYIGDFRVAGSAVPLLRKPISSLTGVADLDKVVFGSRGDVMFYSTPGGVYRYSYYDADAVAAPVLSTSGAERVTCMKLYEHAGNEAHTGRILMVATHDGSAGKVYKIPFNELSGVPGTVETFTGFGEVVDMFNIQ